ncbi:MAG: YfcE family phosphodiesterase [Thermoleophilia bacterium]|nr:YfcE family phosphodiesterase [Thermoleophilia bacterium]
MRPRCQTPWDVWDVRCQIEMSDTSPVSDSVGTVATVSDTGERRRGEYRVGVVADTHVGEFLDRLPSAVFRALEGCDLILHAGDLSDDTVIPALERIAPVVAVRGDHDLPSALPLASRAVVVVAGCRIGVIHGQRRATDAVVVVAHAIAGRRIPFDAGRIRAMARAFDDVDAVVFGHWHEPVIASVDGVLVFSPGAVCPWGSLEGGRGPRPGRAGVADRVVRRYRRQLGEDALRRSVGILTIRDGEITAEVRVL